MEIKQIPYSLEGAEQTTLVVKKKSRIAIMVAVFSSGVFILIGLYFWGKNIYAEDLKKALTRDDVVVNNFS